MRQEVQALQVSLSTYFRHRPFLAPILRCRVLFCLFLFLFIQLELMRLSVMIAGWSRAEAEARHQTLAGRGEGPGQVTHNTTQLFSVGMMRLSLCLLMVESVSGF